MYTCVYYIYMVSRFTWRDSKAARNLRKHHVSFEEATDVFYDEGRVELFDEEHSEDQGRYSIIGFSNKARLLFVS